MTDVPFRFEHDMARRFARIEMSGFWTEDTLRRFQAEASEIFQNAVRQGAKPGTGHILVIVRDFPVQDKALTEQIGRLIPMFGTLSRKVAIVHSASVIQRMQVERLARGDIVSIFEDEAKAVAWLFE